MSVEGSQSEPVGLISDISMRVDRAALEKSVTTEHIAKADVRLPDIAVHLKGDWVALAPHLDMDNADIAEAESSSDDPSEQALTMLHLWVKNKQTAASGNVLHRALKTIGREDIIRKCLTNMSEVTDDLEKAVAKLELEKGDYSLNRQDTTQSGTTTGDGTISRGYSLDVNYGDESEIREPEKSMDTLKDAPIKEEDTEGPVKTPPPSPQDGQEGGEQKVAVTSEEYTDENGVTTKVQRTSSSTTTYTSVPQTQVVVEGEGATPGDVDVGEAKVILRRELRKTAVRRGSKDEVTTVTESRTYEMEGDMETAPPEVRAQMESEVEKFLTKEGEEEGAQQEEGEEGNKE